MSRGSLDEHGVRQHRGRLLQLSETGGSVSSKRRSYGSQHPLFKSLQQMAPSPRIATKLLSLEEVVRKDPGYTPNIEHLVFPSRKNSIPSNIPVLAGKPAKTSARAKLAEVFALSRNQSGRTKQSSQSSEKSSTLTTRGSQRKNAKGAGCEPVAEAGPPATTASQCPAARENKSDHEPMASYRLVSAQNEKFEMEKKSQMRGPNVSILHLRSTSEPWETSGSVGYSATTSRTTTRNTVMVGGGGRYPGKSSSLRREPVQAQGSLVVSSSGSGNCSRELSPVRWCDREVDGVYLGRSGWVQVQQRSLDDNRRVAYIPPKPPVAVNTSHNMPPRLKMSDFHSRSEPGRFPQVDDVPQQRPGFLPLPNETRRTREKPSPSSLDLSHEEPITPPPATPIISPPPAFQDSNKRFLTTATASRARTVTSRSPVLQRSNAIESSPPPSPPASLNWSTLPTQKISPIANVPMRPKRLTPSPVSTPHQHNIPQTKSLEDSSGIRRTVFQKYDSSSSSSSSFGFRSLDSNIGIRIGMPRLNETDSSLGGYEDGDEEDNLSSSLNLSGYSSITMVNSSPDAVGFHSIVPPVERVSPSSLRGRQHHRQMRRSPGSDGSNKKLGSNQVSPTSSSSSSSSRSPSAGPFRRSGSHNKPTPHHREHVSATWDGRGSRVRRSRSLQLPERKSPASSGGASPSGRSELDPSHREYYHGKQEPPRVVVKINGEQPPRTNRRGLQRTTQSEELQREREREEELRREAEEEARVVTEFLYGVRTREAARALIMQRCLEQRSPEPLVLPPYNTRGRGVMGGPLQRPKVLTRGVTAPSLGGKTPSPVSGNGHFCSNPCNPSTCDFWPHCAHRDGIYTTTTTRSSTPLATSPVPPSTLRLSQSYPNTVNHSGYREKKVNKRVEGSRNGYQSTRSSPASLERMNEISPTKHYPTKRGNSLNVPGPPADMDWRMAPQCRQHSHMPMRGNVQASPQPAGLRVGLSDTSSSAGSSMDAVEPGTAMVVTSAVSPDPAKASPIEVNSVIVNTGESSGSSSSSDIWVTTSDRTMTKSPRNAKSSGASTPLDEGRASKSPVRMSDEDHSRPGSAPGPGPAYQDRDRPAVDTQQRSLSLPKSFQSVRDLNAHARKGSVNTKIRQHNYCI